MLCLQVSLPVVRRFVQSVSDQAVGVGVIRGVRPDQQLVKVKSFSSTLVRSQGFKLRCLTLWQIEDKRGHNVVLESPITLTLQLKSQIVF